MTLRHRVERGKQAWQLKLPLMKDRLEIELADRQPLPPTMFRDLLFLFLGERELVPVATLRVWRAGTRVRMDHTPVADVTLDQVSVIKDGAVLQRFRELEIERMMGRTARSLTSNGSSVEQEPKIMTDAPSSFARFL